MRFDRIRRKDGSIEGMPLQLLIMIIVAVVVMGVIMGWIYFLSDSDPVIDSIIVEPGEIDITGTGPHSVSVTVLDTDGTPVKGVVLAISGCGVDKVEILEEGTGSVELTGIDLPFGRPTGFISIIAQRSGMGKRTIDVVVIKGL